MAIIKRKILKNAINVSNTDNSISVKSVVTESRAMSLPFLLPMSLETTDEEKPNITSGFSMPFCLPFNLNTVEEELPEVTGAGFRMPFCLPFSMDSAEALPDRIKHKDIYPVTEQAWRFYGILFDEYIVKLMNVSTLMIEEIKSRITVDMFLLDKNHIKLKWTGSPVEYVQVYKKLDIDEKYEADGDPLPWDQGSTTVAIGDGSYHIQLKAINNAGESNVIELLDATGVDVLSDLNIVINEKTYYFEVNFNETYEMNINL